MRHAAQIGLAAVGLSAPLLLAGCRRPEPRPVIAEQPLRDGYVNVDAYLPLHPAAVQLKDLDRRIALLRKPLRDGRRPAHSVPTPTALSVPVPPEERAAPRPIDTERVRAEVRADFRVRRLAEPDRADQAYQAELDRLRRRFTGLRQEPQLDDSERELAAATEQAERYHRLRLQLKSLEERPEDRLFFNAAQLRRRRELYSLVEAELTALSREQIQRLRRAVEQPSPVPGRIPPERLAQAERRRDAGRQRARVALERLEEEALERAANAELPAPQPPPQTEVPVGDGEELREPLVAAVREVESGTRMAGGGSVTPQQAPAPNAAELSRRRHDLRERLREDLRAVAIEVGKANGIRVVFRPGGGPDSTGELLPGVRQRLRGNHP